jgi:hypothetical protein
VRTKPQTCYPNGANIALDTPPTTSELGGSTDAHTLGPFRFLEASAENEMLQRRDNADAETNKYQKRDIGPNSVKMISSETYQRAR